MFTDLIRSCWRATPALLGVLVLAAQPQRRPSSVVEIVPDMPAAEAPQSLEDLVEPAWKGRVAMAKPLFGTTATQGACLFQAWGAEEAKAFYEKLHANEVRIVPGNKQVAVPYIGRGDEVGDAANAANIFK